MKRGSSTKLAPLGDDEGGPRPDERSRPRFRLTAGVMGKIAILLVIAASQTGAIGRWLEQLNVRFVTCASTSGWVTMSAAAPIRIVLSAAVTGNDSRCLARIDAAGDLFVAACCLDVCRLEKACRDVPLIPRRPCAERLCACAGAVL